ncbi:VanZ family protein [Saccharibacillus sacchari]|uniref:VanZ family protein n=1 Tax=Saccharibacillus sacchari TaxID=456493 RepID=UPI0004B20C8D|nr:VanZ family protein [Saccharibacillus sacchari]
MPNRRKLLFAATSLYTLLVLYFMFFAFGRNDSAAESYTFIFIPDNFLKLPTPADLLPPTLMDLVSLGNIAAFIPFGILIPLLHPIKFVRFIIGFALSITVLEVVQALTMLGSFDVDDILRNSLGAAIGFGAYKLGMRAKSAWRSLVVMGVSIAVLLIATGTVGAGVDQALAKNPGPFVALNEPDGSSGSAAQTSEPHSFVVGGEEIVPEFKLYDAESGKKATYRYKLDNEEFYFQLAYGIPDQDDFKGSISMSVDGQEIFSNSEEYQEKAPQLFEWYFEQAGEITITVEGNEKAWDAGYREMKHWWE